MSTDETPDVPDESDFGDPVEPGSSNEDGRIELDPGDSEPGIITGYDPYEGPSQFGVLEINGQEAVLNLRMVRQIIEQQVGRAVLYSKGTEEQSFEDGDETVTYYNRNITLREEDG